MRIIFTVITIIIFGTSCGIFDNDGNNNSYAKLYVTLQATDEVAIYTPDLKLLKIIDIDFTDEPTNTPHFVVLDEENDYWFVTTIESGWVAQYSMSTDELIDTVYVGDFPALMAIDTEDKGLYVSRMMGDAETYIINKIDYNGERLTSTDIPLASPILHAITMDVAKEYFFTASNVSDWIYRVGINGGQDLDVSMDPTNDDPESINLEFKPIQCIAINDSLIAITCSAPREEVKGQVQIWNGNDLTFISKYEFDTDSRPWHLIKSPVKDEVFVVLGSITGNGGVAGLTFAETDAGVMIFEEKWSTPTGYNVLHGITVDAEGKYIFVSGRGDHMLYKFDAETGDELDSTPLESNKGTVIAPAGISIMQSKCMNCE